MKLKNKVLAISGCVIFIAVLLTVFLIYTVCTDSMMEEALQAAYVESNTVYEKLNEYANRGLQNLSKAEVRFYLESQNDDYTVSILDGEVLFNKTILSAQKIEEGKYTEYNGLFYKKDYEKGNNILIFTFSLQGIDFYRLVNITYIYEKLNMLALYAVIVSAVFIIVSMVILYILIDHTLKPMRALSKSAKRIAEGAYCERVNITSKDEIGLLASDFNDMANAVENRTKELEESEKKKTLFMANLTHELKTPLTAISGYAQTLRTAILSEEDKNEALTYIYEESKRLDRLSKKMTRLLELDRSSEWVFEEIKISALFGAAVRNCQKEADTKNVSLITEKNDEIIYGDFDLLCDVLINLTDNAIKASPKGSCVKLYTENDDIIVEDFGCGIPKDEIEKIPQPFYMVDKSRSRRNGGSGLGLSLVNLILKQHSMNMTIKSELKKGTKVIISTVKNYGEPK